MIGYILALVSSIFFSLYIIPRKLTKQKPTFFTLMMTIGFSLGSLILFIINSKEKINFYLLFSIPAGIIWVISFIFFVNSIDLIGLSRSNQWKNLQGPVGVFLSLIILSEYGKVNPITTLIAGLSIFISAFFLSNTTDKKIKAIKQKGIYFGLLSGLGFGTVSLINKFVTDQVGVYSQQVVWSLSMFSSMLIYLFYKRELKQIRSVSLRNNILGLLAGFIYLGASFFMLQSFKYIAASIGFSIIQLSSLWTILIGVIIFKEININKYYKEILFGLFFALFGVILLALSKR